MSLFNKAMKFAKSPQGKKAIDKVEGYVKSPEGKQKIEDIREKVSGKPAAGSDVNTAKDPQPDPQAPTQQPHGDPNSPR